MAEENQGAAVKKEAGNKIPLAILTMLTSILCSVLGLWYSKIQSDSDQKIQTISIGKDVSELSRSLDRMQKQNDEDRKTRYTLQDSQRDFGAINERLQDHEERLRLIEARRH